jgi:hypothetical protein
MSSRNRQGMNTERFQAWMDAEATSELRKLIPWNNTTHLFSVVEN